MVANSAQIESAANGDFPALARQLFGSVKLDFGDDGEARRVVSTMRGACRISLLRAGAHTVHGDRVTSRSDDPDAIKLLFQTDGHSVIHQGGRKIDVGPGVAVIYDPTRPYALVNPEPVRLRILQIPRHLLEGTFIEALQHPLATRFPRRGSSLLTELSRAITGERSASSFDPKPAIARLFDSLGTMSGWPLATLRQRAQSLIETRLADPGLDLAQLAQRLGCSTRYLHLAFAEVGETPSTYLWTRRVARAHERLADPADDRSISEVAFALGFSSSAHFSRLFRQRYGCSPRQMRLSASPRLLGTCR